MPFTTKLASMLQQGKPMASICRLCFMEREQLERIFGGDSGCFSEWIENLTSVKIDNIPNAPASLCSDCRSTLEAFDAFREMCITNDLAFKEAFGQESGNLQKEFSTSQIKVEYDEDQQTVEDCEGHATYAASTELLLDIYEPKIEDADTAATNIAAHDNNSRTESASIATLAVKSVLLDTFKYPCKICNDKASKLHTLTHKDSQVFQCYLCSEEFEQYNYVSRHIYHCHREQGGEVAIPKEDEEPASGEDHANSIKQLKERILQRGLNECKICGKSTSKLHKMTHKADGVFQCYICAKKFDNLTCCGKHIRWHVVNQRKSCKWMPKQQLAHKDICKVCNRSVSKLHAVTHKAQGLFQCYICKRKFDKVRYLSQHVKGHIMRQYRYVYDDEANNEAVESDDNQGTIEESGASSPALSDDASRVKTEESTSTSKEAKEMKQARPATSKGRYPFVYNCIICEKFVAKLHFITHKAEGSFVCYICSKMFGTMEYVSQHIKRHKRDAEGKDANATRDHIETEEPIYSGGQMSGISIHCDKSMDKFYEVLPPTTSSVTATDNIEIKMEIPAIEIDSNPEEGNYTSIPDKIDHVDQATSTVSQGKDLDLGLNCDVCQKFVSSLHVLTHKAEGLFRCPECPSEFKKFSSASKHIKCHREQGKYACDICEKAFSNAFGLKRHKLTHFKK